MSNIEYLVKDILLNEISNDLAKRIAKALEINEHLTSTYELSVNVEDILSTDRNADPSKSGFYVKLEGTRSGVSFFYDNNLTIRRKPDSRKTRVVKRYNNLRGFEESFWLKWADKWVDTTIDEALPQTGPNTRKPTVNEYVKAKWSNYLYSTPVDGPSYITPDGEFINIAEIFDDMGEEFPEDFPCHGALQSIMVQDGVAELPGRFDDGSPALRDAGYIRVNDIEEENNFIELPPKRPTTKQYIALESWLDNNYNNTRYRKVAICTPKFGDCHEYSYRDYITDDIIKRIKRYYTTGNLIEKIVKKSDGYYVTSEDGKKNLGGPYDNEDKAKERLQQVHYFKDKKNKDHLKIKEAFPWGEEDSFFTREDIDEFTSELQDNVPEDVVIGRGFVEPGNMLEVDWSYKGYEETSKMKIDMRKIKLPSDLIKRFLKPVKEMINNRIKEIDEENAIGESLKESADSSEFGGELTYIRDQELLSKFDDLYNKYENELNSKLNITLKGEPLGKYSRAWKKASIELDDKRKISIDLSYELPDGIYNYIYIMWFAQLTVDKGSANLHGLYFSNHFETTDIGEGYHIAYKDGSDEKDEKLTIDELVNIIKSKYLNESLKEDMANKTVYDFDFDIQPWGIWTKITLEDGSTLYGDVHIKFDNPSDHFGTLTTWKWDDIKNAIKQLLNKKYGYNISFKDILTDREIKNSTINFKSEGLKENMCKVQLTEASGWNINLPRAKDIYRVEFESAKYSTKPPYEKGIKIPYESISVLACSRNAVREFYLRYLLHKSFQFDDAPAYQIFGKLLDIRKQEFGNQYQIDLKNIKNYSEAADKLRSGEKLTSTLPAIKLVDVKLTEGVLNDNTLDITDEVNAEYERITKKFPNISEEELEDRLYSAVANILSGYNFVDGDKSKKIDTIVNNLLKNKHNKVDESLKEDCGTKFDNKFNLKEIMDKGASWKDIYDEVKGRYHNKKDQLEGITKVLLTRGYKGRTFDSVEDALVTAMEMQEDMFGWYDPTIEEYDDILFSLSYLRDRKR